MRRASPSQPVSSSPTRPSGRQGSLTSPESSRHKFSIQKYSRAGVSTAQLQKLKQCFDIFDTDRSGSISIPQLKKSLIAFGMGEHASSILKQIELNAKTEQGEDYSIDFQSFLELLGFPSQQTLSTDNLKLLFREFDCDKKGYIDLKDFKGVCARLGENYSENQLRVMIEHADGDHDGKISFDEFAEIVTKGFGNASTSK